MRNNSIQFIFTHKYEWTIDIWDSEQCHDNITGGAEYALERLFKTMVCLLETVQYKRMVKTHVQHVRGII